MALIRHADGSLEFTGLIRVGSSIGSDSHTTSINHKPATKPHAKNDRGDFPERTLEEVYTCVNNNSDLKEALSKEALSKEAL